MMFFHHLHNFNIFKWINTYQYMYKIKSIFNVCNIKVINQWTIFVLNDSLHTTLRSWILKHKFVLFLKIRTEVVCIVMRDRDARAGIALRFIYKAGNAKYYHPTHNFYNSLLDILSKNCFKELLNTHHLNI